MTGKFKRIFVLYYASIFFPTCSCLASNLKVYEQAKKVRFMSFCQDVEA